jgi:hypothetical protein
MIPIDTPFRGELLVELVVGAEVRRARKDFRLDSDSTLFDYIGGAAAEHFTNFRKVSITINPIEWDILEFSPERKLLRAKYIGTEDITDFPDESEFMQEVFGLDPLEIQLEEGIKDNPGRVH